MKVGSKLRGGAGGVCISFVGTEPAALYLILSHFFGGVGVVYCYVGWTQKCIVSLVRNNKFAILVDNLLAHI